MKAIILALMMLAMPLVAEGPLELTKQEKTDSNVINLRIVNSDQAMEILMLQFEKVKGQRQALEIERAQFETEVIKAHELEPEKYQVNRQTGVIVPREQSK